jgi:hypothetical protein
MIRIMDGGLEEEGEIRRNEVSPLRKNILAAPTIMTRRRARKSIRADLRRLRFLSTVIALSRDKPFPAY